MTKTSLSEKTFKSNLLFIKKLLISIGDRVGSVFDHSESVGIMAAIIAKEMGIKDRKKLMDLQYGAFFHDLGKISIPNRILHKSASLTKREYAVMKTHPSFGYELINTIPGFKDIAKIIHQHHECWDGSGYPHSLKGKQICPGARICALVDSFDAMCSDRRYSSKKPLTAVISELNKCSGTKYDPEVVKALNRCVSALDKVLKRKQNR